MLRWVSRPHFLSTPQTIGKSGNVIFSSDDLHLEYYENLKSKKLRNTLLYCLGEEAYHILASTNIGEEDRKKYDSVLVKFDSFFNVSKNMITEHTKFNKHSQLPGEPVEQFVASLYNLAVDCNFGELKDQLIRNRIVVGIRDASLSERLQMDPELTLEKANTVVWQRETVCEQQVTIKGVRLEAPQLLEAVGQKNQKGTKSRQAHLHRSDVLNVARINIHVMPAL